MSLAICGCAQRPASEVLPAPAEPPLPAVPASDAALPAMPPQAAPVDAAPAPPSVPVAGGMSDDVSSEEQPLDATSSARPSPQARLPRRRADGEGDWISFMIGFLVDVAKLNKSVPSGGQYVASAPAQQSNCCLCHVPLRIRTKNQMTPAAATAVVHVLIPARCQSSSLRAARTSGNSAASTTIWPTSTPRLKPKSAAGISGRGTAISRRAPAKPKPCTRPNAKVIRHRPLASATNQFSTPT